MEERAYFWVGYILVVIIVFIPVLMVMEKTSRGDDFKEQLISNDLALIIDVVNGANGEISIEYTIDQDSEKLFKVGVFEGCVVKVALDDTSLDSGAVISCVDNSNFEFSGLSPEVYSKIYIEKNSNGLFFRGDTFE